MSEPQPKTPAQWSAWRASSSCQIGMDVLNGVSDPPSGTSRMEYATFLLLSAVKELAEIHMGRPKDG